ncbi:MAG TPA: glycoside hydrolase family 127 protein [Allosphingosinicella sp.]|nr:glycoside hydrolase family 127 protein [Allosphingosinicella sp.]
MESDKSFSLSRRGVVLGLGAAPAALIAGRAASAAPAAAAPPPPATAPEGIFQPPPAMVRPFPLGRARLTEGPFLQAQDWNLGFMKRIDPDRLLHSFRLTAGLPSAAAPLGGWEAPDCELRGHFTGHYLSAAALAFASTGDAEMKSRGDRLVAGLAACQRALNQGGYLSAFPIEAFDRLSARRAVWAPFYTIHKIMAGLLDMHLHAGSAEALAVLRGMAEWADRWTGARSTAHMQDILDTEFGGMSETLCNLAAATGEPRWIDVGDRFTKARFITPLAERRDELRGLHMNTHVPQVIGAARRYELTGEPRSGHAAAFFWETVVSGRAYATGGSSNGEHWQTAPYELGDEWHQGANHQECCCAYNMMKLTRALHRLAPRARHVDYYERNLFNHRLGTIQPETGRTQYFLSLAPAAWKTFASDDHSFWCCTGTGMEEYARIADAIYGHDGRGIVVDLFIASTLDWPERGIAIEQHTAFPDEPRTTIRVTKAPGDRWPMRLRIPGWTTDEARVLVSGKPLEAVAEPGSYLRIDRAWRAGDEVTLDLPMPLRAEAFPDEPSVMAFLAGPIVLAGQFPASGIPMSLVIDKQGPAVDSERMAIPSLDAGGRPAAELLRPAGTPLAYSVTAGGREIALKPLNRSWDRYVVYWTVA